MPELEVTVRETEAGRITEVVVPGGNLGMYSLYGLIRHQIPTAEVYYTTSNQNGAGGWISIRQPGGPDVVALAGETLRIAAGRVERVREDV